MTIFSTPLGTMRGTYEMHAADGTVFDSSVDRGEPATFYVMKIKGPVVHLDGNHPLAGLALRMSCKVVSVRQATAEEIAHRHVHGDHGHQH